MRLRRSSPSAPGITRQGRGRSFTYSDEHGEPIRDDEILDRIRSLAIPPAWKNVWICSHANGHIQAAGTDAAGRRQYLYHESWVRQREAEKHRRIIAFGMALPHARTRVAKALRGRTLERERVLAATFRLLDFGGVRIGSERYADEHGTFGLATLKHAHASVVGRRVRLHYRAKGSVEQSQDVVDAQLSRVIAELLDVTAPDDDLFVWCADGEWHDVRSEDVNAYVRESTGGDFTAKDFRTLNATVLMAQLLALAGTATTASRQKRAIADAYGQVAEYLGNTKSVVRASYVDSRVVDLYRDGVVLADDVLPSTRRREPVHDVVEAAVLRLIS